MFVNRVNGKSQLDINMNAKPLLRRTRFWITAGFLFLCSGPIMMSLWPEQNDLWSWTFLWGALVFAQFQTKPKMCQPCRAELKAQMVCPAKRLPQVAVKCAFVGLVIRYNILLNGERLDPFIAGFLCLLFFGSFLSKWIEVEDASEEELKRALNESDGPSPEPNESKSIIEYNVIYHRFIYLAL